MQIREKQVIERNPLLSFSWNSVSRRDHRLRWASLIQENCGRRPDADWSNSLMISQWQRVYHECTLEKLGDINTVAITTQFLKPRIKSLVWRSHICESAESHQTAPWSTHVHSKML
jgi:hypothetical protein